jgi:hypothetical protein
VDGKTLATLFDVTISNYSPVNPVPESVLAGIHGGESSLSSASADRIVLVRACVLGLQTISQRSRPL